MTGRRPWVLIPSRRPGLALLLSLVSGAATAGFAGYYVRSAWVGFQSCHYSGGPGCPAHPFWGLSPELYLAACFLGIGAGAVIAGVGVLTFRGLLDSRQAGYALVALSAIGLIAYGGLAVGTIAGVASGALFLRSRLPRANAPSEWSGSLPKGVPAVLGGPKRPLTDRPGVTEWNGVFAATPSAPPGRGRGRVALPTADRLSAALEKSRGAAARLRTSMSFPPAVVVLPPPPTGIRRTSGGASVAPIPAVSVAGVGAATPAMTSRPVTPRASPTSVATSPPLPATSRWKPDAAEVTPWATPATVSEPAPLGPGLVGSSVAVALPPTSPEPILEIVAPQSPTVGAAPSRVDRPARPAPRPLTEFKVPLYEPPPVFPDLVKPPAVAATAPGENPPLAAPPPPPPGGTPRPREGGPLRAPVVSVAAPIASSTGGAAQPRPPPARAPPAPSPAPSASTVLTPAPPTAPPAPAPLSQPGVVPAPPSTPAGVPTPLGVPVPPRSAAPREPAPPPTPGPNVVAPAKGRTRAWRCPKCNLINAPWSLHCTKCKAEPPATG